MRHIKLLIIILIFASGLYLYKLGTVPPGLFADEASTGFNIYSLVKTGRDEYGKFLPLGFRQMGSFTPPLYIYLSTPIVALLGMSAFSTRLLSVLCGLSVISIVFYLLQEFKICKSKTSLFFTTLFFAVTPWLVFFSRMGYEQNLALLFFVFTVFLFTKSLKNPKWLLLTIPFASLATYADFPMRFLMPLVFVVFSLVFRKSFDLRKIHKTVIVAALIAAFIQIPNLYLATTKSFYTKTEHFYADTVQIQARKIDNFLPHAVSVPLAFARELFAQYSEYFSPKSLFFQGDPDPQRSIPEISVFYFWMSILYLIGIYRLFSKKPSSNEKIILLLLFITPLTGAFTRQPFHVQRTLAFIVPLTFVMGLGIDFVCQKLGVWKSIVVFSGLFLGSLLLFWRSYFILLPQLRAPTWGFEWRELAKFIKDHPNEQFVIDQTLYQKPEKIAYFQLALYLNIDAKIIQQSSDPLVLQNYYNHIDFSPFRKFLNIETKPIDWGESVNTNKIFVGDLVAISDNEVSLHNLTQVFEIKDPLDKVVLRGFRANLRK